jgi:hypothetical protein
MTRAVETQKAIVNPMSKKSTYWVCTIPLAYEVMSLAATEEEAIKLAAKQAANYLRKQGIVYQNTGKPHTPETIIEWFGTHTQEIAPGTAIICR